MVPKVKTPDPPRTPTSAVDTKQFNPMDTTSVAYQSLISTTPSGLAKKANTQKKSLLGGV